MEQRAVAFAEVEGGAFEVDGARVSGWCRQPNTEAVGDPEWFPDAVVEGKLSHLRSCEAVAQLQYAILRTPNRVLERILPAEWFRFFLHRRRDPFGWDLDAVDDSPRPSYFHLAVADKHVGWNQMR